MSSWTPLPLSIATTAVSSPIVGRVIGRPAEGFGPVGGEALGVVRLEPVTESVADDFVCHYARCHAWARRRKPCLAAGRFVEGLHGDRISRTGGHWAGPADWRFLMGQVTLSRGSMLGIELLRERGIHSGRLCRREPSTISSAFARRHLRRRSPAGIRGPGVLEWRRLARTRSLADTRGHGNLRPKCSVVLQRSVTLLRGAETEHAERTDEGADGLGGTEPIGPQ